MNSAISTDPQRKSQCSAPGAVGEAETTATDNAPLFALLAHLQQREQQSLAHLLLSSYTAFAFFLAQTLILCAPLVALFSLPAVDRLLLDLQRQLSPKSLSPKSLSQRYRDDRR